MSNFFNPENGFFTFMGKVFDMLVLNLLWLVLCIPIVTIVPATTALYYAVVKVIRRERSYALKEFWRSFRANFRQGAAFSMMAVVAAVVLVIDFRYAWQLMLEQNTSGSLMLGIFLVIGLILSGILVYLCPILSRFEMKVSGHLKTAFFMSSRHLLTTLVLVLMWAVGLFGMYLIPVLTFVLPVLMVFASSFLLERIFKKYMPKKESGDGEDTEDSEKKDEWYLE